MYVCIFFTLCTITTDEMRRAQPTEAEILTAFEMRRAERSRIKYIGGEDDAVAADENDRHSHCKFFFWRRTTQDLRTPNFNKRRRVTPKEDGNRVGFREIFAIDGDHLVEMSAGSQQSTST